MSKKILITLICFFTLSPLFAAYNSWGIPDSSEIRKQLIERWFEAPLQEVRQNLPEIYSNNAGQKFQVRLEENDETFNIFVAPAQTITVNVYSSKGVTKELQEVYPGDVPGSWVLVRDKKTGKALRIRYYFITNSDVFVQFSPYGRTAAADMVIFDNYAARGSATGVPFKNFYTASFEDVLKMTDASLPWKYVKVDELMYHSVLQMSAVIQENLPRILYTPDAMYNENNELVRISTGRPFEKANIDENRLYLSSAGFVKWIADGLVEPIAGGQLKREPLIRETTSVKDIGYQGILSQKYNLSFALDWIRNLSVAVVSVYTGKTYIYPESGSDVTINPFAAAIAPAGSTKNVITFIEDSGYNVEVLKSLLYILSATEPGTVYFGAIRGTDRTVTPEIKAFNDCVVFLPYFSSNKAFGCFVYMNGRSVSLEDFCALYKDEFIYLTKVRASENFFPN